MAQITRVLVRQVFVLNSGRSVVNRLSKTVNGALGTEGIQLLTSRSLSNFPNAASRYQKPRYTRNFQEDEEDEYDIEDDDLEQLRKQHRTSASTGHVAAEGGTFADFPLNTKLLTQLDTLGYTKPFEIQVATLQHTLEDKDVIARALTGSGKTLAFSIPIVHKLSERENRRSNRSPKAIVISPTRELCLQIHRSIEELDPRVKCVAVYGGASIQRQEQEMRRGVDVICATPGRLNDHLQRGIIDLNELEFLCLDEADELLTPGFKEQIEDVLRTSPQDKQVMLFSATMPPEIRAITRQYMKDPVHIDITQNQKYKAPESVRHLCMRVPPGQQLLVVKNLIDEHQPERCIVFMETKQKTSDSARFMQRQLKMKAEGIHSNLSQARRENIMAAFRAGKIKVLVATDVAARGLDIPEVDLVVQVSPPKNGTDYYIHRSGRTGRAGREGLAVLLHSGNSAEWSIVKDIERLAKIEHVKPPNYEEIIQESAKRALVNLEKHSQSKLTDSLLPLVSNCDMSGEDGQRLLAAAIATIVKGAESEDQFNSGRDRNSRSGYQGNRSYNDRATSRRPYRGLSNDSYDDFGSYNSRENKNRNRQRSHSYYDFDKYDS